MYTFNDKGFLMPSDNIVASVAELKQYFVDAIPSDTRFANFEKYIRYSTELKNAVKVNSLQQWINGSFVSNIKNPKDIDLVTFIDFDLRTKYKNELQNFEARNANAVYGVDAYLLTVFPKGHKYYFLFESDRMYWLNQFSRSRRDTKGKKHNKGFLEIKF